MKAVAYTAEGGLEVVDRPEPEPGPADVIIDVERCGICGSDLHMRRSGMLPPGAVMGHEFAGTVVARGDEATTLAEGDRVAVLPAVRCGRCRSCLEGRDAICLEQMAFMLGIGTVDGAYAEYVRIAEKSCFPMPAAMTPEQGALVEPYAVGLHAVRRSRVTPTSVVGVIGAGPIGLMTLAALHDTGVEHVVVAERSETRAAMAQTMGADAVVDDADRLGGALDAELDVVFECAGVPSAPQSAMQQVRVGGEVVLVGVTDPNEPLTLLSFLWIAKEVDVKACLAYSTDEFGEAVQAVASGAVDAGLMVSDVRPLDAAEASFDELLRPGGPVKVLLQP